MLTGKGIPYGSPTTLRIDGEGKIELTEGLMRMLGVSPGDVMDLVAHENRIVLSPHSMRCQLCGGRGIILPYLVSDKRICYSCNQTVVDWYCRHVLKEEPGQP